MRKKWKIIDWKVLNNKKGEYESKLLKLNSSKNLQIYKMEMFFEC